MMSCTTWVVVSMQELQHLHVRVLNLRYGNLTIFRKVGTNISTITTIISINDIYHINDISSL